uniref:F-box domain-containing protein n=1 Tax=Fagus sylvatica TaxID=28930 RepID=A0A2N9FTH3_FAGSY
MSWCLLPDLVVWMIKDRLGVVSNARMASVCRNWWYASLSYPNHESAPPICIMQPANNKNSSSCYDFICTPTSQREEEKFTVNLPDFDEAELVFSKHGWLLMKRKYSLFLFNPFTKKVFCFDNHGGLFIYDLVTQIWKEVDRPANDYFGWYMVEHQGEIMKLRVIYDGGSGQPCRGSFRIFRYNDDSTAWERLSYDDVKVKDTSWFLNTQGRCFSAKGHGFKLYYLKKHFVRCPLNICRRRRAMLPSDTFHARFHDMIHGTSQSSFPLYIP